MKKLLVAVMLVLGVAANAQEGKLNVGANLSLPVGDISDITSFAFSLEANYLFAVSDKFHVGPSVSFLHYFGKDFAGETFSDFSYLPLAGAARYSVSEVFTIGADLGYGLGISPEGLNSGFYYRPLIGYHISDKIMLQGSYTGISLDGGSVNNIGVGAMFSL